MSELGLFFAQRILKENYTEEAAQFLISLMQSFREGHICLKTEIPNIPPGIMEERAGVIPQMPLVRDKDRIYIQKNWVLESAILEQVERLQKKRFSWDRDWLEDSLNKTNLLPSQKNAVRFAFEHPFTLICGGPGTGKTYTAASLVKLLLDSGQVKKVVLAAPTGKAASHLAAHFKGALEANTLHRLLKIIPGQTRLFSGWKIDADLIVVDETSMIDLSMLAQLMDAVSEGARLVLMGDPDQLPPIEAGSLFAEMAQLFGVRLEKSMRTEDAKLQLLAESINQGRDDLISSFKSNLQFDFSLSKELFGLVKPYISAKAPDPQECFETLTKLRILGALRQGPFGIQELNQQMMEMMEEQVKMGDFWAIPIMITGNSQNLFNGDSGILIGKSKGGIQFKDSFAYFPQKIPFSHLPSFEIAFCLSIHKSQGSEFERVLALFPPGSEHFGRAALYTAITRARKVVQILASDEVLKAMLKQKTFKISGFTERFLDKKKKNS